MDEVAPLEQQLLIAGYILGDLSQAEARLFEQIASANPAVWKEVAQLQRSLDSAYSTETPPPPDLKAAVMTATRPVQPDSPVIAAADRRAPQRSSPRRSFPQWAFGGLGAAAAAVLILALGVQNYTLRQTLQALQASPVEQPSTEVAFSLPPVENSQQGTVELLVNPDQLEATLKAEGLPPLPDEQVYALWTVVADNVSATTDSKNAILTAVFTVDDAGNQTRQIALPSVFRTDGTAPTETGNPVKAIAVTIESAAAPQRHQSGPSWIQRL
ncbi:anti-sigma factor [Leptolyngbya sp. BC1307]|uniref:anti-sigma factor domain-containing protein n=1 Tax=Leptolyngbya sp. BC1307 TaxID=2029589 RepID=UPI000EFA62E7|nr:anti-sigma factor [Leptolyngbya sp. BC1307]